MDYLFIKIVSLDEHIIVDYFHISRRIIAMRPFLIVLTILITEIVDIDDTAVAICLCWLYRSYGIDLIVEAAMHTGKVR
jgi:hypothetical protein